MQLVTTANWPDSNNPGTKSCKLRGKILRTCVHPATRRCSQDTFRSVGDLRGSAIRSDRRPRADLSGFPGSIRGARRYETERKGIYDLSILSHFWSKLGPFSQFACSLGFAKAFLGRFLFQVLWASGREGFLIAFRRTNVLFQVLDVCCWEGSGGRIYSFWCCFQIEPGHFRLFFNDFPKVLPRWFHGTDNCLSYGELTDRGPNERISMRSSGSMSYIRFWTCKLRTRKNMHCLLPLVSALWHQTWPFPAFFSSAFQPEHHVTWKAFWLVLAPGFPGASKRLWPLLLFFKLRVDYFFNETSLELFSVLAPAFFFRSFLFFFCGPRRAAGNSLERVLLGFWCPVGLLWSVGL